MISKKIFKVIPTKISHSKVFGLTFNTWKMELIFQLTKLLSQIWIFTLNNSSLKVRRWSLWCHLVCKTASTAMSTSLKPESLMLFSWNTTQPILLKHHWLTIRHCSLIGSTKILMRRGQWDLKTCMARYLMMDFGYPWMNQVSLVVVDSHSAMETKHR